MKLREYGFLKTLLYVVLMSIAFALIITPYINWFKAPDMTYMEMTIKHVWYWVGAATCSVICIYMMTRNEYT